MTTEPWRKRLNERGEGGGAVAEENTADNDEIVVGIKGQRKHEWQKKKKKRFHSYLETREINDDRRELWPEER